ncbi:hypothetical protein COL30_11980 [Bacillus pseudomycoides]|uniref:DUF2922 domain-containing protein n=1 Tax=Bacillus pseudomycoides TaxID=64104 RepID=A0A2B4MK29_9BACI|nr:hypothetical protein [Bacillus pseudomycoides]PED73069.1 hypothetical protein CON97_05545 [Bacillus pseudomycoides]PEJ75189.1 hypothetical protein CN680_18040 [Bacillus pseudomycoides]PEM73253.1 hypothetical protein CN613_01990 [Bacillus pseudomycoides]PEP61168.1 hypothetical protein CN591_18455 [Bacillus pseudomycoides]PFW67978.1 hypothetical protein COL25_13790 [Bacillus pseudomycoides]
MFHVIFEFHDGEKTSVPVKSTSVKEIMESLKKQLESNVYFVLLDDFMIRSEEIRSIRVLERGEK